MELILDVFNYVLTAIMLGVIIAWVVLIKSMLITFRDTPYLDRFDIKDETKPKVSVILPARNEENFIRKCLDSLLDQDYEDYEIIAVDDSSQDSTGSIIEDYAKKNSKINSMKLSLSFLFYALKRLFCSAFNMFFYHPRKHSHHS